MDLVTKTNDMYTPKTYLFDFDGTLVDSMPTYVSSMLRILDEHHMVYGSDIIKILTPLGLLGATDYFIGMGMQDSRDAIIGQIKEYMMDAYLHTIPAKPNVAAVLYQLKARGDSLNVLTASPHVTLDPCLKRLGLFDLFDNVWSCDDFATTKADPAIYHMAAQKMEKPVEQVLFLDDNLNADVTAKAAGMKVCGVYDDSSAEYTQQIKDATDFYIDDFSRLPELEF